MKTITISKDKPTNVWLKTFFSILLIALIFGFSSCQDESSNQLAEDYLKGLDLGTLSGTSQSASVVYFEKRRFTRTSEAPFEEIVRLENPNFEHFGGDFVLKVQNGSDKQSRVSSAEIIVDGETIVSQSDFSKKVSSITKRLQGLTPESVLEIKLNSTPGSFIEIWIEGTLKPNHALFTPDGGTYTFMNGKMIFDVPKGAIETATYISVEDILCDIPIDYQPNIQSAFELLPHGLNFNIPIEVRLSSDYEYQDSDDLFVLNFDIVSGFGIELNSEYNLIDKTIQFSLPHFSFVATTHGQRLAKNKNYTFSVKNSPDTFVKMGDETEGEIYDKTVNDVKLAFDNWESYSSDFGTTFSYIANDPNQEKSDIRVEFLSVVEAAERYNINVFQDGNAAACVLYSLWNAFEITSKRRILINDDTKDPSIELYSTEFLSIDKNEVFKSSIAGLCLHEIGHLFKLSDEYNSKDDVLSIMGNRWSPYFPVEVFHFDIINLGKKYGFDATNFGIIESIEPVGTIIRTFQKGQTVYTPLVVKVLDNRGEPVQDVTVVFYYGTQEIGLLSNCVDATDENGIASIKRWNLPNTAGEYHIIAKTWADPEANENHFSDIQKEVNFKVVIQDDDPEVDGSIFYNNDFSGGLSDWIPIDGSWQIQNGRLIANYDIGCGSIWCPQADLLLKDQFQPSGDWELSVDFTYAPDNSYNYGASGAAIIIWDSPGKKIRISIGHGGSENWGINPETIMPVSFCAWDGSWDNSRWNYINYTWRPREWHTMTIDKTGNVYTVYVDDDYLWRYTDNYMNGTGKIGLQTYGPKTYDNFIIRTKD